MGDIRSCYNVFKNLDLKAEVVQVVSEHSKELADINRQQLKEKGQRADGKKLKPYRNKAYSSKKHEMNPLPGLGNPDLRLTGALHESIFATADENNNRLILGATDDLSKVSFLVGRDGPEIFGVSMANQKTASGIVRPALIRRILQKAKK